MKALIVRLSSLGDVVMTLPMVSDLAAAHPEWELHWLVNAEYAELVACHRAIRRVHRRGRGLAGLGGLRRERYDLVLDAQGLWKSALVARLAGAKEVVGFDLTREPVSWLYRRKVPAAGWGEHATRRYRRLAAALGAAYGGASVGRRNGTSCSCGDTCPSVDIAAGTGGSAAATAETGNQPDYGIVVPPEKTGRVAEWLARVAPGDGPLVLVNPFARWESKLWPLASWTALLSGLPGTRRLVLGSAAEAVTAEALATSVPGVVSAAGVYDLVELWALLGQAAVVVSVDSGPMHIAGARGVPLVALFGPTDPGRTGPYPGAPRARVLTAPAPCRPCFKRECADPRCLDELPPETVLAAVRATLGETKR